MRGDRLPFGLGLAANRGLEFLTIYLGPALVALLWPTVLRKLVRVAKEQRITTISDLVASRYGKSGPLGTLVAVLVVCGMIPYIALQLKAVSASFRMMIAPDSLLANFDPSLIVAFTLGFFGILDWYLKMPQPTLEQEIRDAFTLVNFNGRAFRNARITEEYLAARLDELKWAALAQVLPRAGDHAQIHRRGLQTELRFVLMGLFHPLLVLVPQHRAHRRAAADNQRILAELSHLRARRFVGQQHDDQAAQRRGRQQFADAFCPAHRAGLLPDQRLNLLHPVTFHHLPLA